jgi:ABC-2 type transport system ATP-binding protein
MLSVRNLTKQFGSVVAVREVSFEVKPGRIFSLIGPNGSGKTTIVKVVCGLLKPSAGAVFVCGSDVVKEPERAKAQIGYVPDEPSVWQGMTGEEFLHFVGALYGMEEAPRRRRIPELLAIFNLQGIQEGYFEDYSRGNKQKFAILAALLHTPRVLLIDEPIVGLDPQSAEVAKNIFQKFAAEGGTVLMVTHTLSVAREISSEIGVLQEGRLVAHGSFEELRERAKVGGNATLEEVYRGLTGT